MKTADYPIPQTLLEIAGHFKEYRHSKGESKRPAPRECFRRMRELLPEYSLSDEDYSLISIIFERFLKHGKRIDARELAERLYPESVKRLQVFQQIRRLVGKGLLEVRGMRTRRGQNRSVEEQFSLVKLVESDVLFRESFLQHLIGEKRSNSSRIDLPFEDNREFLESWFIYIKALKSYRDVSGQDFMDMSDEVDNSDEDSNLRDVRATYEARVALTNKRFPLQELVEEEGFDEKERDIIVYLLKEEVSNSDCGIDELIDLISEDQFDRHQNRNYFSPHSRLVSRGIVELRNETFFMMMKRSEVRLAPDVSRRLMSRSPESDAERLELVMQGQDIFDLTNPAQSFSSLILPYDLKHRLETAVERYQSKADLRLREWGIDREVSDRKRSDHDEAPLLMLFSGASGTGKTFAAGAFAQKLGRQLLVTDVSRVLSCMVGESEQNVRRMFHLFDRLVRRMENPPVLLLNECDQFLMKRGSGASGSVDRMYHQMQNLFLEAFEKLRGILIATTNLAEGIDPAFSRRFHLKLDFPMPDIEARLALWQGHLPKTLPLSKNVKLNVLAKNYEFSGGQISLVVRNAAISAAVRGDKVTMEDLQSACQTESLGAKNVTGAGGRPIGFAA